MSDLTPAEFREHQATELPDTALQRLIDAAELAIATRYGSLAQLTDRRRGGGTLLFLSRPAAMIATVTERYGGTLGGSTIALDPADYTILQGGMIIRREATGPHPADRWSDADVDVTYTPADDQAERTRVTIALVKLDLNNNPGLTAEAIGDWSQTYADNSAMNYGLERRAIIDSMAGGLGFA